jgi:stearoyl-CoA desaturase (delta-9 desaturase)
MAGGPSMTNARVTGSWLREIDWPILAFIGSYHVLLAITLPIYLAWRTPGWTLLAATAVLLVGSLTSITAGYHRLYAHRTYRAKRPVELVLLFFGTLAAQSSVLNWAHDHRLHHNRVDTDGDPYGTQKGFWHSHMLWLFKHRPEFEDRYVRDLLQNELVVFQHRYYGWLMAAATIAAFLAVAAITGDPVGAFAIGVLLRLFLTHHSTWCINSAAHKWGTKPYSLEHSAVNNFFIALITYGEGYHNYHHTFARDYRNGVRWYQFDPPKYLIWVLSKVGLVSDLKRTDPLLIRKRLVLADRQMLIEHLERFRDARAKAFAAAVERTSHRLAATMAAAKAAMDRYRALDTRRARAEAGELRRKARDLKREFTREFRTWRRLCRQILDMEPA